MAQATRQTTTRILARRGNVVAVDSRAPDPDPPRFPGAAAADHPPLLQPDDDFLRVALWPRGRRIAA